MAISLEVWGAGKRRSFLCLYVERSCPGLVLLVHAATSLLDEDSGRRFPTGL